MAAQYRFDQWTADNGLPQNTVSAIAQTADGYLWLATNDGLVRFDGVRFTVFNNGNTPSLPNNRLSSLLADGNDLWIADFTRQLVRFRDGEFKAFAAADGLESGIAELMMRGPDAHILVNNHTGIFSFENERFVRIQKFTGSEFESSLDYYAPSGTHWNLTPNKLTRSINGQTTEYEISPPVEIVSDIFEIYFPRSMHLVETSRGELWFPRGNTLFTIRNDKIFRFSSTGSFSAYIAADSAGDIWFFDAQKGICHFERNQMQCIDRNKLRVGNNEIRGLFFDREGMLWIASEVNGLFRLTEQLVTPLYTDETAVGKNVYPILEDSKGAVWIGTSDGLSVIRDGKFTD